MVMLVRVIMLMRMLPGVLCYLGVGVMIHLCLVVTSHPHLEVHQRVESDVVTAQDGDLRHSEGSLKVYGDEGIAVICLGPGERILSSSQTVQNC